VVLEVAGRLGDVVTDLDLAIELALAEAPRGVVCDLSEALEVDEAGAVEMLASAGRSGIPVAVASQDPLLRAALAAEPLGAHLIVTESMFSGVSAVLATTSPVVQWRRLAPHPTAPRASRDFVSRTLLDWRLGRVIPFATLVVSELVTSSTIHSGTDMDLSIAWHLGALRLTVADHSVDLPRQRHSAIDVNGRGVTLLGGLTRAFGVLPMAGGKVVWAVLNAARPRASSTPLRPEPAAATQGPLRSTDLLSTDLLSTDLLDPVGSSLSANPGALPV